jgi:hypothetical protein
MYTTSTSWSVVFVMKRSVLYEAGTELLNVIRPSLNLVLQRLNPSRFPTP